mmetsp:Transcript_16841/g.39732  ORF Transcript_16841/g.39732 Transcript_16841/m.39732 type:complete len:252 (-) Transcript_16841:151-906(-)
MTCCCTSQNRMSKQNPAPSLFAGFRTRQIASVTPTQCSSAQTPSLSLSTLKTLLQRNCGSRRWPRLCRRQQQQVLPLHLSGSTTKTIRIVCCVRPSSRCCSASTTAGTAASSCAPSAPITSLTSPSLMARIPEFATLAFGIYPEECPPTQTLLRLQTRRPPPPPCGARNQPPRHRTPSLHSRPLLLALTPVWVPPTRRIWFPSCLYRHKRLLLQKTKTVTTTTSLCPHLPWASANRCGSPRQPSVCPRYSC